MEMATGNTEEWQNGNTEVRKILLKMARRRIFKLGENAF